MRWRGVLAAAACAVLAACATTPRPSPPRAPAPPARPQRPPPGPQPYRPSPPPAPVETPMSWPELPGWIEEDHLGALAALGAACRTPVQGLSGPCAELRARPPASDAEARALFERWFQPERIAGQGLLTAYFSPVYEASDAPAPPFTAPVRPRPAAAAGTDALDRAAIDALPADDALAWMRPEDLFFLQVQGSGVLVLPDGRRLKAAAVATNGLAFVGIARPMREQGLLADTDTSGEAIRAWLAAHRGPEADAVMQLNPRYVFFALKPDDGADPPGAAGIPLPPGRAIAVDRARHALGELFWIDASAPVLRGARPSYRRVAAALDVGGAITGEIRADLYLGRGDAAGREAGRVRHLLTLYRLRPLAAAAGRP